MAITKEKRRKKIKKRIRSVVNGTANRPRLTVFRSNKQIYAQLVDDVTGVTLASVGSAKNEKAQSISKVDQAKLIGAELAEAAKEAGITEVVFDRNGYLYHGRVKSLAEAAREAGLKF